MTINTKILHVLMLISFFFLVLVISMTYFQVFNAEELATSGQNPRSRTVEMSTKRGSIYDAEGVVLAETEGEKEAQIRKYPHNQLYSQIIGYSSLKYGKTLLENTQNGLLLGLSTTANVLQLASGDVSRGADVTLTLSHKLQKKAKELLNGRNGSVVAIEPKTGKVLAMYSEPSFDPNEGALNKNWSQLIKDENSPLLPRVTSGLYAPGSVFKIITTIAALELGLGADAFDDTGDITINGKMFKNYNGKSHGEVTLDDSFKYSLNTYFAQLGTDIGQAKMEMVAERAMVNRAIPFDVKVTQSRLFGDGSMDDVGLAATAIGQGELLVTPFNMALLCAAIANEGVMMKPYIVSHARIKGNLSTYEASSSVLSQVTSKSIAGRVGEMMLQVVESGTGTPAKLKNVRVAGKTGTAENERQGKDHSWFVCYAPYDQPEIAVCVMVEYAGATGSDVAAPIASRIVSEYLGSRTQ